MPNTVSGHLADEFLSARWPETVASPDTEDRERSAAQSLAAAAPGGEFLTCAEEVGRVCAQGHPTMAA